MESLEELWARLGRTTDSPDQAETDFLLWWASVQGVSVPTQVTDDAPDPREDDEATAFFRRLLNGEV